MAKSARDFFNRVANREKSIPRPYPTHSLPVGIPRSVHDTFSILLARGRAQVGVAASRGDWPKRTQDQAYSDQNHASAA